MKELSDGTKVSSRSYYYLLEWNEYDHKNFIVKEFAKQRLCDLNRTQYKRLFNKATTYDLSLM